MAFSILIDELLSLEQYAKIRDDFRREVMAIKAQRQVYLGEHIRLLFENRKTVQYQVQEMLRIERIFEENGILEELSAYNPLIPDGHNLKATMMIEYTNATERRQQLSRLIGVESAFFLQVNQGRKIRPISNEDLERQTSDKTSSVHFLRFELNDDEIHAFKQKLPVLLSIEHPNYQAKTTLATQTQQALTSDFD